MNKCKLTKVDSYAIIQFYNEGKFNPALLSEFNTNLDAVIEDESMQALILTGSDKNFSQGLDIECMAGMKGSDASVFVNDCMKALGRLMVFPMPVVSALNGHAFGLGAMITLISDYAVMRADKGFFCLPEIDIRMNLIPSMNALVCHKIHGRVLRDILLTGKRVGGEEAKVMGIVDESASEDELLAYAKQLPLTMMGKDRKVLSQLKTGINQAILPENFL